MIHLFSSASRCRSLRRATAMIAVLFLAAGGAFAVSPSAAADGPPPASRSEVLAGLRVGPVRAEIVILVDISLSMSRSQNNLYSNVLAELPVLLSTLASQERQDTVVVIEFASAAATEQIYEGPPSTSATAALPPQAAEVGTNIGFAFQKAIEKLQQAPPGIQAGGVLLLSDGQLYAPEDPGYGSYSDPGWSQLRTEAQHLPMKVTGYGLPLTTSQALISNVSAALGKVFGTPLVLAGNPSDLNSELGTFEQQLLNTEVTSAAAPDVGKGVRVSWSGLPARPLDMTSSGQMDVKVTLTATTQRVPLYLTGLSVSAPRLPTMSGTLPASDQTLAPGQSVTLPVHLTWRRGSGGLSLTSGRRTVQGQLVLAGHVYSTYTQTIKYSFNDTSFATGSLSGASSAQFPAITLVGWNLSFLPIILALALLLRAAFAFYRFRIRLSGTFTLSSVDDDANVIPLSRWRLRRSVRTDDVIGIPGRMIVRGNLFDKGMRIRLHLENRPSGELDLAPGGRTMIAGIDIVHDKNPGE